MSASRTQQLRDFIISQIEEGARDAKDLHKSVPKEIANLYGNAAGLKAAIQSIWDDENMGAEEFQRSVLDAARDLAASAQETYAKGREALAAGYDEARAQIHHAQDYARETAHRASEALPDRESVSAYCRRTKQKGKDALPLILLAGAVGFLLGTRCHGSDRH